MCEQYFNIEGGDLTLIEIVELQVGVLQRLEYLIRFTSLDEILFNYSLLHKEVLERKFTTYQELEDRCRGQGWRIICEPTQVDCRGFGGHLLCWLFIIGLIGAAKKGTLKPSQSSRKRPLSVFR